MRHADSGTKNDDDHELSECTDNGDMEVVLYMFLTHLCLPISQIGQAALPLFFRPCETENMETVEPASKTNPRIINDYSHSFNVNRYCDSNMDWSSNQSSI